MDEQELKKNGFQSSLFLKGFFLVNKKDKKKLCRLCTEKMEFSVQTGNSTLKRHLKAKNLSKFEEIRISELELIEFPFDESGSSEESFGSNMKNRLNIKNREKSIGLQLTLKESLGAQNKDSVIKNFTLLKAIHGLPYRIFDSVYFKKALESKSKHSKEKQISLHI